MPLINKRWDGGRFRSGATFRRWTGSAWKSGATVRVWNGSDWVPGLKAKAVGGVMADVSGWITHRFTSSGQINFSSGGEIEVILVGAGGAGGSGIGGGGGSGGLVIQTIKIPKGAYNVTVPGPTPGHSEVVSKFPRRGANGGNASFYNLTAFGGGGGAATGNSTDGAPVNPQPGLNGGSGGGSAHSPNRYVISLPNADAGKAIGGINIGFNGGYYGGYFDGNASAGGGGGGGAGGSSPNPVWDSIQNPYKFDSTGGPGRIVPFPGGDIVIGGGGGGGVNNGGGGGGSYGGGKGGGAATGTGKNGTGIGSGGGGTFVGGLTSGGGAPGVVYIKYKK